MYGYVTGNGAKRVQSKQATVSDRAERRAAYLAKKADEANIIKRINRYKAFRKRQILSETSEKYNISIKSILSRCRLADLVIPRRECAWRLRAELNLSYPKIAKFMNRKDHTTALYAVRQHQKRINNGEKTNL